ncbi:MAG TPA: geranyl transferase [Gammaproteobacteria bacterium]|nr:geranyl transferase [Gammaproteobacteria bacterium]
MPTNFVSAASPRKIDIQAWQVDRLAMLEAFLKRTLDESEVPERLREAMGYSLLSAGKRIRGLLVYATGDALAAPLDLLTPTAAALECIHAYSLIHDDLPAMDDDDLRRGKPSNHIEFDEATAILAGDALLTLAFELISSTEHPFKAEQSVRIMQQLAVSAGRSGMVGGQMLDIQATGKQVSLEHLQSIHSAKTGALIKASVLCGAYCGADANTASSGSALTALNLYADNIGLAFQIMDDILDETSDTKTLGKQAGADRALDKSTYPQLLGLQESRALAEKLLQEALESIEPISDNTDPLKHLAERVVTRVY